MHDMRVAEHEIICIVIVLRATIFCTVKTHRCLYSDIFFFDTYIQIEE